MRASTSGTVQISSLGRQRVESQPVINMAGDVSPELMLLHSRYTLFLCRGRSRLLQLSVRRQHDKLCLQKKESYQELSVAPPPQPRKLFLLLIFFNYLLTLYLVGRCFLFVSLIHEHCTHSVYFGLTSNHSDSLRRFSHTSITVVCVCFNLSLFPAHIKILKRVHGPLASLRTHWRMLFSFIFYSVIQLSLV